MRRVVIHGRRDLVVDPRLSGERLRDADQRLRVPAGRGQRLQPAGRQLLRPGLIGPGLRAARQVRRDQVLDPAAGPEVLSPGRVAERVHRPVDVPVLVRVDGDGGERRDRQLPGHDLVRGGRVEPRQPAARARGPGRGGGRGSGGSAGGAVVGSADGPAAGAAAELRHDDRRLRAEDRDRGPRGSAARRWAEPGGSPTAASAMAAQQAAIAAANASRLPGIGQLSARAGRAASPAGRWIR